MLSERGAGRANRVSKSECRGNHPSERFMCGIVGYIGKKNAVEVGVDGLRALQYRGYDSAGIAFLDGKKIVSARAVGKIENLEERIDPAWTSNLGIFHTRWATHGGVTEENAHPHGDCAGEISLCHNGIIENFKEIKEALVKKGHTFRSETDSEVLPHLIEDSMKSGVSFEDAFFAALSRIKGTYGIVAISAKNPNLLLAARNFSPLLVGIGDGERFVASDASAILKHTPQVVYLDDGEVAILSASSHAIYDRTRVLRKKPEHTIEWSLEEAKKGGYVHFMEKEISEEPEAIENSIRGRTIPDKGLVKLGGIQAKEEVLRSAKRILISACGTAYFAGRVGEYMLEEYAGIPTKVDIASEFRYRKPVFREGDVFFAISQSGETADTLAALREAREKGVPTFGIVNVVGSTITRETDAGVYQHVGPEIGVASTKAFTSQVAILALLSVYLGRQREMSLVTGERVLHELTRIPALMRRVIEKNKVLEISQKYLHIQNFFFLGRKYNFPVALEGALKLKEVSYVHAEGIAAGELKHGAIAMIDKNILSVVIAPKDSVYEKMASTIQEIKARGGPVLAIATEGDSEITELADDVIFIPKTLEMLTPLLSVVPLQLFSYHFGVLRGFDVDKPRNLAKSVTVE